MGNDLVVAHVGLEGGMPCDLNESLLLTEPVAGESRCKRRGEDGRACVTFPSLSLVGQHSNVSSLGQTSQQYRSPPKLETSRVAPLKSMSVHTSESSSAGTSSSAILGPCGAEHFQHVQNHLRRHERGGT